MIPFCEYFVIPYFLWFAFIAVALIYFGFFNKNLKEYYQLAFNLGIGMTLFLIISYIYPNGQDLRPETFANDNIFTQMVQYLYSIDTPTNVFPSIHVYNSVAVAIAFMTCRKLQKHPAVRYGTVALAISIVLATMFLKQHSVSDVCCALIMNLGSYMLLYRPHRIRSLSLTLRFSEEAGDGGRSDGETAGSGNQMQPSGFSDVTTEETAGFFSVLSYGLSSQDM